VPDAGEVMPVVGVAVTTGAMTGVVGPVSSGTIARATVVVAWVTTGATMEVTEESTGVTAPTTGAITGDATEVTGETTGVTAPTT
jgi:hypothetical protein